MQAALSGADFSLPIPASRALFLDLHAQGLSVGADGAIAFTDALELLIADS